MGTCSSALVVGVPTLRHCRVVDSLAVLPWDDAEKPLLGGVLQFVPVLELEGVLCSCADELPTLRLNIVTILRRRDASAHAKKVGGRVCGGLLSSQGVQQNPWCWHTGLRDLLDIPLRKTSWLEV